ncbi:MAG TPA: hypothetical protein VM243_05860 [Phycisphaerae bacterium]|nr:hypothetical protein [Phycisphaerae bacterium]
MFRRLCLLIGLLLLLGCAAGGPVAIGDLPTGNDDAAPGAADINEDGKFISEQFGFAFRLPAEWEATGTSTAGQITFLQFASTTDGSRITISVSPPADTFEQQVRDDPEQALEYAADLFARDDRSFDAASQRTFELSSGHPAAVMDVLPRPEEEIAGGRLLLTYGNELVYGLVLFIWPEAPDLDLQADTVVESFRMIE